MFMFIKREGKELVIDIHSGVDVEEDVLILRWNAEKIILAELLKNQLLNQFEKFKREIALQPHLYLNSKELSALKLKLVREWDSVRHDWKRIKGKQK